MSWLLALLAAIALGVAWWQGRQTPAAASEASIAVLPFTVLSDAREDRYYAEGLSMEMVNALAGLPGLKVAAWRPAEAIDRALDGLAAASAGEAFEHLFADLIDREPELPDHLRT